MATSTLTPVTACCYAGFNEGNAPPVVAIGDNRIYPKDTEHKETFWYLVLDMEDELKVIANATSSSVTEVPSEIASLVDNPRYFLLFLSNQQITGNVPQGGLHAFLCKVGAGGKLRRLEQIIGQLGTGSIASYAYALAATMDTGDRPGFEEMTLENYGVLLTMQFMPMDIDGKTVYAPVQTDACGA